MATFENLELVWREASSLPPIGHKSQSCSFDENDMIPRKCSLDEKDLIPAEVRDVLDLIGQRASLMRAVAANKFADALSAGGVAHVNGTGLCQGPSVYVAKQEIVVFEKIQKVAEELRLPRYALLVFAQLQTDYAKLIQQHWLDIWDTTYSSGTSSLDNDAASARFRDSETFPPLAELRASIGEIDGRLYRAIKCAAPLLNELLVTRYGPYAVDCSPTGSPRSLSSPMSSTARQQEAIIDALGRILDQKTRQYCANFPDEDDAEDVGAMGTVDSATAEGPYLRHCGYETVNYNRVVVEALCSLARGVYWDQGACNKA